MVHSNSMSKSIKNNLSLLNSRNRNKSIKLSQKGIITGDRFSGKKYKSKFDKICEAILTKLGIKYVN